MEPYFCDCWHADEDLRGCLEKHSCALSRIFPPNKVDEFYRGWPFFLFPDQEGEGSFKTHLLLFQEFEQSPNLKTPQSSVHSPQANILMIRGQYFLSKAKRRGFRKFYDR